MRLYVLFIMAMRRLRREKGATSQHHTHIRNTTRHRSYKVVGCMQNFVHRANVPLRHSLCHDQRAQDREHDEHYDGEVLVVAVEAGLVERSVPDAAGAKAERATEGTIGREDF